MEFRMSGLFSNLDFRDAFKDLFLIRKDEIIGIVPQYGPLANILINHVVKAAKGEQVPPVVRSNLFRPCAQWLYHRWAGP